MLKNSFGISILFIVMYGFIFVCGIIGNCFVVITISKPRLRKRAANILIGNLAIADLLVIIFCVPFTLSSNLIQEWPFGEIMCKLVAYIQALSVSASINSLVALSLERFLTINSPFRSILFTKTILIWIIIIWCLPIFLKSAWLIVFHVKPIKKNGNDMICTDNWTNQITADTYFITVNFMFSYLLPLLLIFIFYFMIFMRIKSRYVPGEINERITNILHYKPKINVIKMLLIIVITFALTWLPLYLLFFLCKFFNYPKTKGQTYIFHIIFPIAQWLGAFNSCIHPIIYTSFSRCFRMELKRLFKNNVSEAQTSKTQDTVI